MKSKTSTIAAMAVVALLAATPAWAGTIYVDINHSGCVSDTGQADPYGVVYCNIRAAIYDATSGDTLIVADGTYPEQIYVDKTLDLTGAGIGLSIIEAPDPGDRSTYSITQWTGSARDIDAVVGVKDAGTVNITGFTIDGRDTGPSNFYGIHFFDTDGSVTNCRIEDISYPAAPGDQRVVSLIATHSLGETFTIDVSDNVIPNLQKGGIVLMGPGCTFTVNRNSIADVPSTDIAGNGIQLSYGATGTTEGNVVEGTYYLGPDWGSTGILLMESGDISMDGDEVSHCQMGVNFSDWGWIYEHPSPVNLLFENLYLHNSKWALAAQMSRDGCDLNMTVTDCVIDSSSGDGVDVWGTAEDPWGGVYYTGWENGDLDLTIHRCLISNTTGDGLWTADQSGSGTNNATLDCSGNSFINSASYGVNHTLPDTMDATECWWNDPTGPTISKAAGEPVRAMSLVQPYGPDLPNRGHTFTKWTALSGKGGDGVTGPVIVVPFLSANVVCVPDLLEISQADHVGGGVYKDDVAVRYFGGGTAPVYGYSVDLTWDSGVVTAGAGDFQKPASGAFADASLFIVTAITGGMRIDSAIGGVSPGTMSDDLFEVTFTAAGALDHVSSVLTLTLNYFRDPDNNDITGLTKDNGLVIVDVVAPSVTNVAITNTTLAHTDDYIKDGDNAHVEATISDGGGLTITADLDNLGGGTAVPPDSYAGGVAVWDHTVDGADGVEILVNVTVSATDDLGNSTNASDPDGITLDNIVPTAMTGLTASPGHEKAELSWDDASGNDPYYDGVVIRYDAWGDYPLYDTGAPSYPADYTAGDGEAFNGTGTSGTHSIAGRDIYYYGGFVYDIARNYSPAPGGGENNDRATNYWLGDISDGTCGSYDGYVSVPDVTCLGATYGYSSGEGGFNAEADVGPTDDHSRMGIPEPDDQVQFEDLMIFALNFGVVSPLLTPPAGTEKPVLAWVQTGERSWTLRLVEPCSDLKGLHLTAKLPDGVMAMVTSGGLLAEQEAPVFLRNIDELGLDTGLAILGTGVGISGSGDLICVTLSEVAQIEDLQIDARSIDNDSSVINPQESTAVQTETGPTVFSLVQNFPNPFNPVTKIRFSLPETQPVRLTIYSIDGRRVTTLLEEECQRGHHEVVWDGRDSRGHTVASGVYFYKIEAGPYSECRKMILTK